jgi:hypothetical protein
VEDGFSFETQIVDHMSGPAKAEADALERLIGVAEKTADALGELAHKHEEAGKHAHKHKGFLEELWHELVPKIVVAELVAEGIKKIGEAIVETAIKMGELAVEGVHFALEMSEFKENAIAAYTAVQGTAEEGERTFEEIDQLGRNVHMPVERAHDMAVHLMQLGMENTQEVENAIQHVSDLQRTGNAEGAGKLQHLIERGLASGTFNPAERMMSGIGVTMPELLDQMSKDMHKPIAQIKAEMHAGRINIHDGLNEMEKVFQHSKIHEIAAKKFTLDDLITDMHNSVRKLFEDVDTEPLMHALHDMGWAFGQGAEGAGTLKSFVTDTFNWIIRNVSPVIDAITELGLHIEIGFLRGKIAVKPLLDDLHKMGLEGPSLDKIGEAVEFLVEWLVKGAVAATDLAMRIAEIAEFQVGLSNDTGKLTHALGGDIVEGVVKGIEGGAGSVEGAIVQMVTGGIAKGNEAAENHSPSRKGFRMGANITKGLALGIDDGASDVARALGDSVDLGSPGMVQNDNARHVTVESGAIQVNVHAPHSGATAHEMREVVESALEDVLEQFLLEVGG